MKKLTLLDRCNATFLLALSPEWPKVKRAQQRTEAFVTPVVSMPLEMKTINGREIRFAQAGPSDAPLVVLLSPFPASILSFSGCWKQLTSEFNVVAIDLPGFGGSKGDRTDMTPKMQGAHLSSIFNTLGLHDIHLIAPDVGMAAALSYVLDQDHRLSSMAIGHSIGNPEPLKLGFMINMMSKFRIMRMMTGLLGAGPLVAYSARIGAIRHRPSDREIDDYLHSYSGRASEVVWWFKDFHKKSLSIASRLSEIKLPTLVFWGELDVLFDAGNAKRIHRAIPNSELTILPDAGHFSWADQPELFASMVTTWVNGNSS